MLASYPAFRDKDAAMNVSGPVVSAVLRKTASARAQTSLILLRDSIEHNPTHRLMLFSSIIGNRTSTSRASFGPPMAQV
jgi:hypothetical protein